MVYRNLLVVAVISLIFMPFLTSFNEIITMIFEKSNIFRIIQNLVSTFTVKVLTVILNTLGIPAVVYGSNLYLTQDWMPVQLNIGWNFIGWQSFIILLITLLTGLKGPYTLRSKVITVILAIKGTLLVIITKTLIPILLAYHLGYVPSIIFHNYLGTLLTLLWFAVLWNYAFKGILVRKYQNDYLLDASQLTGSSKKSVNENWKREV